MDVELIAKLQTIQNAGTAGWQERLSADPKTYAVLRSAELRLYPARLAGTLRNNIVTIAQNAINWLTAAG